MKRPVSIMIFGVLNIIFGASSVISIITGILQLILISQGGSALPQDFSKEFGKEAVNTLNNSMKNFMTASLLFNVIVGPIGLISGIGLVMHKAWGRITALYYAGIAALVSIIMSIMTTNFMKILTGIMFADPRFKNDFEAAGMVKIIFSIGLSVGLCCSLIYPLLLLYFMNRTEVVSALNPDQPPQHKPPEPPPI